MARFQCACGEWVSSTENHKCKPQPFNVLNQGKCKVCGVNMAQDWTNGTCIMCDWYLGEGYTENEIKEKFLKKS